MRPKASNAHPAIPPLTFSNPVILDNDHPKPIPNTPSNTELPICASPQNSVHNTVLATDQSLALLNAMNGI
jgi:hypothetical protein